MTNTTATSRVTTHAERIAALALQLAGGLRRWVPLHELRAGLGDMDRADQDAALVWLRLENPVAVFVGEELITAAVSLAPESSNARVTPLFEEAALRVGRLGREDMIYVDRY